MSFIICLCLLLNLETFCFTLLIAILHLETFCFALLFCRLSFLSLFPLFLNGLGCRGIVFAKYG